MKIHLHSVRLHKDSNISGEFPGGELNYNTVSMWRVDPVAILPCEEHPTVSKITNYYCKGKVYNFCKYQIQKYVVNIMQ